MSIETSISGSTHTFENAVLKTDIGLLKENVDRIAEEALDQVCDLIVGYAKVYVNVDTGSLRDSIRKERGGEGLGWRLFRVRAGGYIVNPKTGRLVDYAAYVESRFPFLAPAIAEVEPEIGELIAGKLRQNFEGDVSVSRNVISLEIKANREAVHKLMQGIRNFEYIMFRSFDIFRRLGLPPEFDGAMRKLTQVLMILNILQTTMSLLSGDPLHMIIGILSGAGGVLTTLDLLNNLG